MWRFRHWPEVVDLSGPLGAHFEDQFCVTPPGVPRHSSEISSLLFPQLEPPDPSTSCSGGPDIAPPKQSSLWPMDVAIVGSGRVGSKLLGNTLIHMSG